ncbi:MULTISPECIES: hypothetical protein [unclassified Streptomyces]|uniref:SCO2583 family membrane protein n=1 Tax=unclassified Streptomyces TaxID=2593676 RepID=UPI0022370C44|nr:hypothetical protein [Streptomyces sp. SHP 1-2]MCW5248940.1 hypothetical protein [Streptomyces sp. SHP 1-2]
MGGPGDPPEGTPPGGEDEYRSVVFDESFIRAARLQEFSARERLGDHTPAVRRRPPLHRGLPRQAIALVVLIALAFGTAVYLGVRHSIQEPGGGAADRPARTTVVPLAPQDRVPGADDAAELYAHSPAARLSAGAAGIPLPDTRPTAHFSDEQVRDALITAKDYIVRSSLDPAVLAGRDIRPVRTLLDSRQFAQFDEGLAHPAADGRHAPTGWLVRFDPSRAVLADDEIRVRGVLRARESDSSTLEVTADHVFVYALRAPGDPHARVSLFTVRRELRLHFDRENLRLHRTRLVSAQVQAGPLSCGEDAASRLRPLLAGQSAGPAAPAVTDPYSTSGATVLCGTLAREAQPRV